MKIVQKVFNIIGAQDTLVDITTHYVVGMIGKQFIIAKLILRCAVLAQLHARLSVHETALLAEHITALSAMCSPIKEPKLRITMGACAPFLVGYPSYAVG